MDLPLTQREGLINKDNERAREQALHMATDLARAAFAPLLGPF